MKVLITGITGFIGQRLFKQLGAKDDIYVICRKPVIGFPKNVSVMVADLNGSGQLYDNLKIIRPDVCVHLAWEGIPDYGYITSRRNLDHASALWHHLVEECGCSKIIATGSCWEYGKSSGVCREEDLVTTDSYFSWAKHSLYDLGSLLAVKYGITFNWARIFYAYGPGQRGGALIPMIKDALKKNEQPKIKMPYNANDFVHVDDIAQALNLFVHQNISSGIYNLGSGRSTPVWQVCEYLEKALGRPPLFAKKLQEVKQKPVVDFWADMSKTSKALGWSPKIGIEEGIGHL